MENNFQQHQEDRCSGSQPLYTTPGKLLLDLFLISVGNIICAVGVNGLLLPNHFAPGGITGLSIVIHNFFPLLNLGCYTS